MSYFGVEDTKFASKLSCKANMWSLFSKCLQKVASPKGTVSNFAVQKRGCLDS